MDTLYRPLISLDYHHVDPQSRRNVKTKKAPKPNMKGASDNLYYATTLDKYSIIRKTTIELEPIDVDGKDVVTFHDADGIPVIACSKDTKIYAVSPDKIGKDLSYSNFLWAGDIYEKAIHKQEELFFTHVHFDLPVSYVSLRYQLITNALANKNDKINKCYRPKVNPRFPNILTSTGVLVCTH